MKKYKVIDSDMKSPFRGFQYEIGKEYTCRNFDDSDIECSAGFYATDLEGITYSFRPDKKVFEVEMSGREKKFDHFRQRWEKITVIREIPEDELKELLKAECDNVGYNILEACFPINPLKLPQKQVTDKEIKLLSVWDSVWHSVWASVEDSVRASVLASVWDSVWASVLVSVEDSVVPPVWASVRRSVWASAWDSVWHSMMAYISSLFPNIKQWPYVDHKEGENPFQAGIDLWRSGFVPSFDGTNWRLHSGLKAKIVYEMK